MSWSSRYLANLPVGLRFLSKQVPFSKATRTLTSDCASNDETFDGKNDNSKDVANETTNFAKSEPLVIEEHLGDVALIGINRPDVRNCVDSATALALREAFERFEKDEGLKSAVLHGIGGNFCAGYDLAELASGKLGDNVEGAEEGESTVCSEGPTLARRISEKVQIDASFRPMGPSKLFISKVIHSL